MITISLLLTLLISGFVVILPSYQSFFYFLLPPFSINRSFGRRQCHNRIVFYIFEAVFTTLLE